MDKRTTNRTKPKSVNKPQITTRVPLPLLKDLNHFCIFSGLTKTQVVIYAIREYLKKENALTHHEEP